MRQDQTSLRVPTRGQGLHEITSEVTDWVLACSMRTAMLTVFVRHTSASLTIQENADPDVLPDLQDAIAGLAPHGGAERYRHHSEGPDDMAAHIRTVLSGVHLAVPVRDGAPMLGTWQGIYLWEHRDRGRNRRIALHLLGSG